MSEYDRLWREINGLKKNVRGLSQPQLAFSTVEDGYVTWRDADGNVRLRVGLQEDGTQSILHMNGPKPPTPSAPTVTVDGVVITADHDGSNVDGAPLPADYRRRIVYAGFASDMSDAMPVATIEPPTGGQAVFMSPGNGTVYVAVRTETHATMLSEFSEAVPVEVTMVSLEGELEIIKDSANGKNKNYYSPTKPATGSDGDVWFDTSIDPETGQPKWGLHLWDGSKWVTARDSRLQVVETAQAELAKKLDAVVVSADGGNKNFYSTTAPTKDIKKGDLWFDGSKGNTPHRWDGKNWVSVADERVQAVQKAQEDLKADLSTVKATADGKNQAFYQPSKPTGTFTKGDLWFDTSTSGKNRVSVWDGSKWVDASDKRVADVEQAQEALKSDLSTVKATADGKNQSFYQPTKPTGTPAKGDLWFDTSMTGKNKVSVWDGKAWVDASDQRVQDVQKAQESLSSDIAGVRKSVDGKTTVRWEASVPTSATPGGVVGDTWHQYKDGKHVGTWRWDGSKWIPSVFDPVMIPLLDIGTGTFGELDGARIKADSVQAGKVLVKGSVGSTLIADGAITTSKIATGAITAESGVVGSLDAGTIKSGFLDSARIQAGSIRADQMQVSTDDNWVSTVLLANGITAPHRSLNGSTVEAITGNAYGPSLRVKRGTDASSLAIRAPEGSSGNVHGGTTFPVQAGTRMMFRTRLYRSGSYTNNVVPSVRSIAYHYKPDGSYLKVETLPAWVKPFTFTGETTSILHHEWVIPQGAAWMQIYIQLDSDTGWVVLGDPVLKPMVGATVIEPGAITTEKIATGAITAESGVIGSLDLGKATVGELDGSRIKAGTLTVGQLLSGTPTNVLPGADNLAVSNAGWTGFGRNVKDPSVWLQGTNTVETDASFELSAGVTYTAATDVKSSVSGTVWFWQIVGQDGQKGVYCFSGERAGTTWRTATSQFSVPESGKYKLRVYGNHPNGADNKSGYQWWRNPRISPAVDTTLIKDGSITTEKIATGAITAESGVIGSLDAGKITAGEMDGARIKAGTVQADKVLVKGSVGSTVIADGAVTTDKIATGAITAESGIIGSIDAGKITVGEMDGARIKANTVGTDLLKAGAVTAKILDATAIDGKTITGATIRTSIRGARVQLDSTGIHAYNPNGVETVTISAITGEASVTGDLVSGLAGVPNVRIQNSLWNNAQWSDWDGTTVYATGAGVRIGREDSYGSVGFAEISGSGGQVIDPETEGLEGTTPTIKPALVVTGPGQTTTDRASLGFYGDGSALLRSKDGAPLTLRSHSNRGDYVRLIGNGAVKLRSTGGAGLSLTKEGQVILKPGLGGKDSARLYMYDSAIIQTRGGDPAQLRTGNDRANLTVGAGGGEITMRADNVRVTKGTFYYQTAPTTGQNPNMHIDSNGWVAKTTSSRRYKRDIHTFDVPDALLDVPFRTWIDKGEYERNSNSAEGLTRIPGLIAEEVAEACPELVIYDDKGRPDALAGDRIGMAALTLIRRQRDRITRLEERITQMEGAK